jgi:cytochrome d ubiquinol oxidase subunit II
MPVPLDYETLRLIWWVLLGVLLIGFALTDGYDMGVGALLPFIARTDEERRLVINAIGATWEGHQVWLIVGGASMFAAWPLAYAVSFSGFYLAIFLLLAALILRPVAFKYRSKKADPAWRSRWDWALFTGSFVPALLFGVAVGNVLTGAPFRFDTDMRAFFEGNLFDLLGPFPLVAGLLSVAMLVLHGCGWLSLKIEEGPVLRRARQWGLLAGGAVLLLFAGAGAVVAFGPLGFALPGPVDGNGPSNPHLHMAVRQDGAWLLNYGRHPWMLVAPLLGLAGPLVAMAGIVRRNDRAVFAGSGAGAAGIIATAGLSMFPFLLPSSIDPGSSLTVFNASSSALTLWIMLLVVVFLLPVVLVYTAWVLRVLSGRITTRSVRDSPHFY